MALALAFLSLPAAAQDPPPAGWTIEAAVDQASRYLFRGSDLLGGESVTAPRLTALRGGWTVYYEGSYGDLPAVAGGGRYVEADFGADYRFRLGDRAALTVGAVTFRYGRRAEEDLGFFDTYEVYAALAFAVPLAPTFTYSRDVDAVDGGYATFGLGREVPLGERARLVLSAAVGFDFGYNNPAVADGTLDDVLLGADLPVRIGDRVTVRAGIQRSLAEKALDDLVAADPELADFYGDRTVVTAGITVALGPVP